MALAGSIACASSPEGAKDSSGSSVVGSVTSPSTPTSAPAPSSTTTDDTPPTTTDDTPSTTTDDTPSTGDTASTVGPVDADGDGHDESIDCDDGDPDVHPDADEVCDGVDQDCNGLVDDDPVDGVATFVDADGDGYGSTAAVVCEATTGFSDLDGDCGDDNPAQYPGAPDVCGDAIDNDCDPSTVEDCVPTATTSPLDYPDRIWGAEEGERLELVGAADLDGDGTIDILVDSLDAHHLLPVPVGEHLRSEATVVLDGVGTRWHDLADVTGDGVVDLVSRDAGESVTVMAGPFPSSRTGPDLVSPLGTNDAFLVDPDGDGTYSVVLEEWFFSSWYAPPSVDRWIFHAPWTSNSMPALVATSQARTEAIGELDGEPGLDLLSTDVFGFHTEGRTVDDDFVATGEPFELYPNGYGYQTDDLNGDGLLDRHDWVSWHGVVEVVLGPLSVDKPVSTLVAPPAGFDDIYLTMAGDLDGDGHLDLVANARSETQRGLFVLPGPLSEEMFCDDAWIRVVVDEADGQGSLSAMPLGDVDGDGYDDLAILQPEATDTLYEQGSVTLLRGRARE
jgi:hypothetical protein